MMSLLLRCKISIAANGVFIHRNNSQNPQILLGSKSDPCSASLLLSVLFLRPEVIGEISLKQTNKEKTLAFSFTQGATSSGRGNGKERCCAISHIFM